MYHPLFDTKSFDLPNELNDINPKAKLTILKALVKDPADPNTYPDYDEVNSTENRNIFHSKDSKQTYEVYQDNTGHTHVTQFNNDGELFKGAAKWGIASKATAEAATEIKMDEDSFTNKSKASVNPSASASLSTYSYANREVVVSNDDGSAIAKDYSVDVNKFSAKASMESIMEKKGLSMGYDLANGSYKLTYIEEPKLGIDPDNPGRLTFNQGEYGVEVAGGLGAKIDIKSPADLAKVYDKVRLGASVGISPVVNMELDDQNYIASLPESDRLRLQNEAIERELSGKSSAELNQALQLADPDLPFTRNIVDYNIPVLTDDQRVKLEEQLEKNQNLLEDKYGISKNGDGNGPVDVNPINSDPANTDLAPVSDAGVENIYNGFPASYSPQAGATDMETELDEQAQTKIDPTGWNENSVNVEQEPTFPADSANEGLLNLPQEDTGIETDGFPGSDEPAGEEQNSALFSNPSFDTGVGGQTQESLSVNEDDNEDEISFQPFAGLSQEIGDNDDFPNALVDDELSIPIVEENVQLQQEAEASDDVAGIETSFNDEAEHEELSDMDGSKYAGAIEPFDDANTNESYVSDYLTPSSTGEQNAGVQGKKGNDLTALDDVANPAAYVGGEQDPLTSINDQFSAFSTISDALTDQEGTSGTSSAVPGEDDVNGSGSSEIATFPGTDDITDDPFQTELSPGVYDTNESPADFMDAGLDNDDDGPDTTFDGVGPTTSLDGTGSIGSYNGTGPESTYDGTGPTNIYDGVGPETTFDGTGPGSNFDGTGPETTFDGTGSSSNFDGTGAETTFDGTGPGSSCDGTGQETTFDGTGTNSNFDGTVQETTFDGTGPGSSFDGTGPETTFDGTGPSTSFDGTGQETLFDGTNYNDTSDFQNSSEDFNSATFENDLYESAPDPGITDDSGFESTDGFSSDNSYSNGYDTANSAEPFDEASSYESPDASAGYEAPVSYDNSFSSGDNFTVPESYDSGSDYESSTAGSDAYSASGNDTYSSSTESYGNGYESSGSDESSGYESVSSDSGSSDAGGYGAAEVGASDAASGDSGCAAGVAE